MRNRILAGVVALALAFIIIDKTWALADWVRGDSGDDFRPYLLRVELQCSDGRTLHPYDKEWPEFCGQTASGILKMRVAMENNGFEDRTGMTPYWPPYPGDCWPSTKTNERTICRGFD